MPDGPEDSAVGRPSSKATARAPSSERVAGGELGAGLGGSTLVAAVGGSTRGLTSGLAGVATTGADTAVGAEAVGVTAAEAPGEAVVAELLEATGSLKLG